jgi:hypothetical protein
LKKTIAKKAQVYGLSSFLYALAIAIVLVIGLLGMSKQFEEKSQAAMYRFGAVETSKVAEIIKKVMDQERSYAVDKSLFITGAFGGYSTYNDFLNTSDCRLAEKISGCGTCAAKHADDTHKITDCRVAELTEMSAKCGTCASKKGEGWECSSSTGNCKKGIVAEQVTFDCNGWLCNKTTGNCQSETLSETNVFDCKASISDPTGTKSCGLKEDVGMTYIGEKKAAYWRIDKSTTCVPSLSKVISVFSGLAGNFFAKPNALVAGALSTAAGKPMDFNYVFKLGCYPGSCQNMDPNTLETKWFYAGSAGGVSISYPPEKPVVDYEFQPYVHLLSKTDFFKTYNESKNYVENEELGKYLVERRNDTPIPVVVDEDFIVARGGSSVSYPERNCTTDKDGKPCGSADCGYPSDYCTQNHTATPRPFQALVNFTMNNYPDGRPHTCYVNPATVSNYYDHDCTIYTMRASEGWLVIDAGKGTGGFSG